MGKRLAENFIKYGDVLGNKRMRTTYQNRSPSRRHQGWIAEEEFQDRIAEQQRVNDEAQAAIAAKVEKDDSSCNVNIFELPGADFSAAGVSAAAPSECPPVPEDVAKLAIEKDIRCSSASVHCAAWLKFSGNP